MTLQMDQSGKDDLKTQFATREGTYRLMTLSEYSRPNRVGYQTNQSNPQVRVSLVTLPPPGTALSAPRNSSTTSSNASSMSTFTGPGRSSAPVDGLVMSPSLVNSMVNGVGHDIQLSSPTANHSTGVAGVGSIDRICFNFGKELYVYAYRGCKKVGLEFKEHELITNFELICSSRLTSRNPLTRNCIKEPIRVATTSTKRRPPRMALRFSSASLPARSSWCSLASGNRAVFLTKR